MSELTDSKEKDELPPLISAAQRGSSADTAKLLKDATLDPNETDAKGKTALHWASYFDESKVLRLLLSEPRVDTFALSHSGETSLHMCAVSDARSALTIWFSDEFKDRRIKIDHPRLVDVANKWGETALHLAAAAGKSACVELFCTLGKADTTLTDSWGRTPLKVAKQNGEKDTFATLSKFSSEETIAEASLVSEEYYSSHPSAKAAEESGLGLSSESVAVSSLVPRDPLKTGQLIAEFMAEAQAKQDRLRRGDAGTLDAMVKVSHAFNAGGKVVDSITPSSSAVSETATKKIVSEERETKKKSGLRPLSQLCEYGVTTEEMSKLCSDPSVDCDGRDYFGLTMLHKCVEWRRPELIAIVVDAMSVDGLLSTNSEGQTSIHRAAMILDFSTLDLLRKSGKILDWKAACKIQDHKGLTALDLVNEVRKGLPAGVVTEEVERVVSEVRSVLQSE